MPVHRAGRATNVAEGIFAVKANVADFVPAEVFAEQRVRAIDSLDVGIRHSEVQLRPRQAIPVVLVPQRDP